MHDEGHGRVRGNWRLAILEANVFLLVDLFATATATRTQPSPPHGKPWPPHRGAPVACAALPGHASTNATRIISLWGNTIL
ncbi:hypothetical protein SEVIR_5G163802v4 [Setaria viridis]